MDEVPPPLKVQCRLVGERGVCWEWRYGPVSGGTIMKDEIPRAVREEFDLTEALEIELVEWKDVGDDGAGGARGLQVGGGERDRGADLRRRRDHDPRGPHAEDGPMTAEPDYERDIVVVARITLRQIDGPAQTDHDIRIEVARAIDQILDLSVNSESGFYIDDVETGGPDT